MRATFFAIALLLTTGTASFAEENAGAQYAKPGFVTVVEKGRLWVFREGSKELEAFQKNGEPTISMMKIGAGPEGMTLKAPSMDVIDAYLAAQ